MIAYHGDPKIKERLLAQLQAHHDADEIVKGKYWENGKGCAVGCTVHSGDHAQYEPLYGIPQMLARLEDTIFEGLPNERSKMWAIEFADAVEEGTDLSLVGWKFQHWLLIDEKINPGINHPLVRDAVKRCADVLADLANGKPLNVESARSAARSAAESAARSAESAARSAESAARSAARSARSAAWSAESAAESAESAAESARSAADYREKAYVLMADKLLELIVEAGKYIQV
jgi:hypothetical protein